MRTVFPFRHSQREVEEARREARPGHDPDTTPPFEEGGNNRDLPWQPGGGDGAIHCMCACPGALLAAEAGTPAVRSSLLASSPLCRPPGKSNPLTCCANEAALWLLRTGCRSSPVQKPAQALGEAPPILSLLPQSPPLVLEQRLWAACRSVRREVLLRTAVTSGGAGRSPVVLAAGPLWNGKPAPCSAPC